MTILANDKFKNSFGEPDNMLNKQTRNMYRPELEEMLINHSENWCNLKSNEPFTWDISKFSLFNKKKKEHKLYFNLNYIA